MTGGAEPSVAVLPLVVCADPGEAAARAAEDLTALVRAALEARGVAWLAVSGGVTPWRMLAEFDRADLPWEAVHVFQVDERLAPEGHPDRNLTRLRTVLGRARLHPVPMAAADGHGPEGPASGPDQIAVAYAAELPERFDVVHLGLGADGHTASLVPGDPVLDVVDRPVAVTASPYQGRRRVTLTYPTIARARAVRWLVTGADKRDALRRLLAADRSVPAGRVAREHGLVVADRAAARA